MNWVEIAIAAIAGGGVRELVTLFTARRKAVAESETNEITNTKEAIAIWRETAEKLYEKVDKLQAHIEHLEEVIRKYTLKNEN